MSVLDITKVFKFERFKISGGIEHDQISEYFKFTKFLISGGIVTFEMLKFIKFVKLPISEGIDSSLGHVEILKFFKLESN